MEAPQQGMAYVVRSEDNVATAITAITAGFAQLLGARGGERLEARMLIPGGHKMALRAIEMGDPIVKYGMCIGTATRRIDPGAHVHLHNMRSNYDARASALDIETALSTDVEYTLY